MLRDVLAWKKKSAHHRAQRISEIFKKRGLEKESIEWDGWRLGNLAPIYEPIAWFFKPYKSITITDNILKYAVGRRVRLMEQALQIYLTFGLRRVRKKYMKHKSQLK